ncbi:MAG: hypothetical protein KIT73_07375, partial [Burkholderiales bacterium]|nr:hypothetical protein [Burkholderiales bacterium]
MKLLVDNMLKSSRMHRPAGESRWLPWFGRNGKLALGWSCFVNRSLYPTVERTFEGIAQTRRAVLMDWAETQWRGLATLAGQLDPSFDRMDPALLDAQREATPDFSELFVIDSAGRVQISTSGRSGPSGLPAAAVQAGLAAPFLHGPYVDPLTLTLGPSSSRFHDEVTLMFYQPIRRGTAVVGCLCGRVPNDVIGDLIQREGGHVYRDSGDNYVFMVESRFDPAIKPGTALSRSRFEDDAFTLGDNLRDGVHTAFGTVTVRRH